MPAATSDELSDLQNTRNSVLTELKTVEAKVTNLYKIITEYAASYDACVQSTKVESPTATIDSCNVWLEKQSAIKSDITALTTLLASLKAKLAAVDNAIAKYQTPTAPVVPSYSFNDRTKFDSAVTAYFSKYVGDVRAAYKANGIPEEFTNAVPSPPNFSNSTDNTNDSSINNLANNLQKWWQLEHLSLKEKISAKQNATGSTPPKTPSYYFNDPSSYNSGINEIYAKYVDDIKYQLKKSGIIDVPIDTVPTAPIFSNTTDGTNDAAIKTYTTVFAAWHAKALAVINKYSGGNSSGENSAKNQYDNRGVFEEQVTHYYDKYVNGALDWMAQLGVSGGFQLNPPNKPAWTNTTDGTNDRLVNAFISQISVWWSAQNDRLQPIQDKYDEARPTYQYNDLNSFTNYKNAINQKFIGSIIAEYKAAGIEFPEARQSGTPQSPGFLIGKSDGTNQENLQRYVNSLSGWYMAETAILNQLKAKLGIKTPSEQDQSLAACGSIYEKVKGTFINIDIQVGNLELMISNSDNFSLKSKALGLNNFDALENYWYGQLGSLKQAIDGGFTYSSDKQNFQAICATHPQYTELSNSVINLTNRYDELRARYVAISGGLKKSIDFFMTKYLGNDASIIPISERNQSCINVYNSVANEINSRMIDLMQIQDLMQQRMPVQIWISKHPANSWLQVSSELWSILGNVNSFARAYKQTLNSDGKIAVLCSGTDSGPSVILKLNSLTDSLMKLELDTTELLKKNWAAFASKPWEAKEDSSLTMKICSEFSGSFNPSIAALANELTRLRAIAGKLSGGDSAENAYFVANTQQLLIQLKNSAWLLYDKMKQSSLNINGCASNGILFQSASKIAENADSEYNAFTAKWNAIQSIKKDSPMECSKYLTYYQQRAAGYMDLLRIYAEMWKSRDSILEYVNSNQVQSWQAVFEIFMSKSSGVANMVNSDRSEILSSKIQSVCSGTKDGDEYLAKTFSLFAISGPLTYMQDSTFMAIKNAFGSYSRTSFLISNTTQFSQEQTCNASESYYSQLSNSLILSLQNLGSLWSSLENILLYQKTNAISVAKQFTSAQNQLKEIAASMNTANEELKAGKLANACKGLTYSTDYQSKIDSLFNPASGSLSYWYAISKKSINDTYSTYQGTLERPSTETELFCKNFSVESLKSIATVRSNISAIREKLNFTQIAAELSVATKNLSYQNMGTALLDLQNVLIDVMSKLQEYQKTSKCTQIVELLKQGNSAIGELKFVQSEISSVGWNVGTSQEHAISTVANAEKTLGGDSQTAVIESVGERATVVDRVKATVLTSKSTKFEISTNYPYTKLTVVAIKPNSSKKVSFSVTTSKIGNAAVKSSSNLKGYQVTIFVGGIAISKSSI